MCLLGSYHYNVVDIHIFGMFVLIIFNFIKQLTKNKENLIKNSKEKFSHRDRKTGKNK